MPDVPQPTPEEGFHVLRFLRGIDLTGENFHDGDFPRHMSQMSRLLWCHLRNTGLDHLPSEIGEFKNLEFLSLSKNNLSNLHGSDLSSLDKLRVINCRKNKISNNGLPDSLWINPELQVVDLSKNKLTEVRRGLRCFAGEVFFSLSKASIPLVHKPVRLRYQCYQTSKAFLTHDGGCHSDRKSPTILVCRN